MKHDFSFTTPLADARTTLGLASDEINPTSIERAYRRALADHPADRDPDGFESVTAAHEALTDPLSALSAALERPTSFLPQPRPLPPRLGRPGDTTRALLRAYARVVSAGWLLGSLPESAPEPIRRERVEKV